MNFLPLPYKKEEGEIGGGSSAVFFFLCSGRIWRWRLGYEKKKGERGAA